jgi:hypothetical protein
VLEPRRGVVALLVADDHHPPTVDTPQPADDRRIVAECPVAGQFDEIVGDPGDIIVEMRPLRMPRDLGFLPRSQPRISVAQQLGRLRLEASDLGVDVDRARSRGLAQLGDASLELGDRLLEIQEGQHSRRRVGRASPSVNDPAPASTVAVRERMPRIHQLDQPRAVDVGVDLSRRNVGVAEQGLQHSKVGAARQ